MPRADAQRNIDALLAAAEEEFAARGVDVNVRAIATRACVGTATLYRHFPLRSDLVAAVFRREVDACAAEAPKFAATHDPGEALELWIQRYARFIAGKRGLAATLHSGDPAFQALPGYFQQRLGPALQALLDAAVAAGAIRDGVDPIDLLAAVAKLSVPRPEPMTPLARIGPGLSVEPVVSHHQRRQEHANAETSGSLRDQVRRSGCDQATGARSGRR